MRAPIVILIISAVTRHCRAEVKPVVTFTPNWRTIFSYESMIISCDMGSMAEENPRVFWFKDGNRLPNRQQIIKIESAFEESAGSYQCWVKEDLKSDLVRLNVVGTPLILQAPPVIYIGEPLTLRCYSLYQKTNTTFFKKRTVIHFSVKETELRFPSVDWSVAGTYSCSQHLLFGRKYKKFTATTILSVQENPHTSFGGMASVFPWILAVVLLLQFCAVALLLFKCRHKLPISGCHQQRSIPEPERKCDPEPDDICYTYINVNNLPKALPLRRSDSHVSIEYSLVTEAQSAISTVEGPDTSLTTH